MGDSTTNNKNNSNFDFSGELSTLVTKNKLPKRLAEKIENKLKTKNVSITKDQFYNLIDKITKIIKEYKKDKDFSKNSLDSKIEENSDIQKLMETIENLQERLDKIENKTITNEELNVPGYKKPKISTTDDIKVEYDGEWDWKPLKNVPNDPESIILLMKWLQYLIDKCGQNNLSNILDYYVDIGWITQDVKIELIDYSHGITQEKTHEKTSNKNITDLPSKDHIQSFIFIQKLKGIHFDKHFIDRIEGDISRITKNLKTYDLK